MVRFPTKSSSSTNYDFSKHDPRQKNGRSNRYDKADKPHNECFGYMSLKKITSKQLWFPNVITRQEYFDQTYYFFGNPQYISWVFVWSHNKIIPVQLRYVDMWDTICQYFFEKGNFMPKWIFQTHSFDKVDRVCQNELVSFIILFWSVFVWRRNGALNPKHLKWNSLQFRWQDFQQEVASLESMIP